MRALLFSLTMVFTMCLASCNRNVDDPFLGKWTFDRDYTQSHLPKDLLVSLGAPPLNDPFPKGFPEDSKTMPDALSGMMNKTLKPALTKQLISQMEDQSFAITPKLITGVDGIAKTYEVIEHPNADTWSLKQSDGDIWTVTSEDGRLSWPTTGDVHFRMYFKRAGQ